MTARSHELIAFGPVEESARVQLDRCLTAAGDEARAVLCADHHKGYSMPIGGVLASQTVVMPPGSGAAWVVVEEVKGGERTFKRWLPGICFIPSIHAPSEPRPLPAAHAREGSRT